MLSAGQVFAGYRIESVAGTGGMGVVYRATQLALDRTVALKVIAPGLSDDPAFRERFAREARIAAAIDHPCVAAVHESGVVDGIPYLVMSFIDGEDLSAVLARDGRVPPRRAASIVEQVAAALEAAHAAGLVHRDVKPANIRIAPEQDGRERVYLTDFGLSRRPDRSTITRTGQFIGTPDYMAPEQLENAVLTGRADIYSLGCVLFEMLTGRIPYPDGSPVHKLYAHVNEPRPRPSQHGVDPAFDPVIARAMAKRPEHRYSRPAQLAAATRAAADADAAAGVPPASAPPAPGRAAPSPPRRPDRRALIGAAGFLALAVGIAVALVATGGVDSTTTTATSGTDGRTGATATQPTDPARAALLNEVRTVYEDYSDAQTEVDLVGLGELLDDDVLHTNNDASATTITGKAAVLGEYARQFAARPANQSYLAALDERSVLPGAGPDRLVTAGTYRIINASGTASGDISLTLARSDGDLKITNVLVTPGS